jgi:hypothetical protein
VTLRLSSKDPFVSRRRVLVYRCHGLQPSWHRQPKLESSLAAGTVAPGTAGIFFEDDWAVGTGRLYSPFVQADLAIKIKTKRKHKREKGQSKAGSESYSERTKGESDFTLLSLHVNVSKAVVRRRTLLQIK